MSLHYDDKGKFFTEFVAKDPIEAVIKTVTNRIEGCIYVRTGERVSDELNRSAQFLAVTDAIIFDLSGKELYRNPFMLINRDQIVWLMPDEKNTLDKPDGSGNQ